MLKTHHQAQQPVQQLPNHRTLYHQVLREQDSVAKRIKTHAWGNLFLGLAIIFATFLSIGLSAEKAAANNSISDNPISVEAEVTEPYHLNIPIIGLTAKIESSGADENGIMISPSEPFAAGWWRRGPKPGEKGSAVIAGHVDAPNAKIGLFYDLNKLSKGDYVYITTTKNRVLKFEVARSQTFPADNFPIVEVFGNSNGKFLNLITCAGVFEPAKDNFSDRLVVFTRLVE